MINNIEIVIRLVLGALLGGIIGFERESHGRPAGFRTHLIVGLAGALIMIVSEEYYHLASQNPNFIRIDPARIAAGAITGVGFLGAGVIVKYGFAVQGLTTAACLWIVSIIGLAIGSGIYFAGIFATFITVTALWYLRRLERRLSKTIYKQLVISAESLDSERDIENAVKEIGANIRNIDYEYDSLVNEAHFHITISFMDNFNIKELAFKLSLIKGIRKVNIKSQPA